MTLIMTGRIVIAPTTCEKCSNSLQPWGCPDKVVKCSACGAIYIITDRQDTSQGVELTCEFSEFRCIHKTADRDCDNNCPAADMYCKEHLSDKEYDNVKNSIEYWESLVANAKNKLEDMDNSRKIWLTVKLSDIK